MPKTKSTFKDNLHALLVSRGISASGLANDIGVSPKAMLKLLRGETSPRFSTIKKIADYFAVSPAYLLGEEPTTNLATREARVEEEARKTWSRWEAISKKVMPEYRRRILEPETRKRLIEYYGRDGVMGIPVEDLKVEEIAFMCFLLWLLEQGEVKVVKGTEKSTETG